MDIELVKKHYKTLDNSKLLSLATNEARGLRAETIPLLIEEIRQRGLNEKIIEGLERQLKKATPQELLEYSAIIQKLPCPGCGMTSHLNGGITKATMSFILFTKTSVNMHICCGTCLKKARANANTKTILLGWWGFPWGIIKSIQALTYNSKISGAINNTEPSPVLLQFINENIGRIEIYKDNPQALRKILG